MNLLLLIIPFVIILCIVIGMVYVWYAKRNYKAPQRNEHREYFTFTHKEAQLVSYLNDETCKGYFTVDPLSFQRQLNGSFALMTSCELPVNVDVYVLFVKTNCGNCQTVKTYLAKSKMKVLVFDISKENGQFTAYRMQLNGALPIIRKLNKDKTLDEKDSDLQVLL